jgi:hypothetical protein
MYRGSLPHSTLFPEAFVCDRGFLFNKHRRGFSQDFKDWCDFLNLGELYLAEHPSSVRLGLEAARKTKREGDWDLFCSMKSTAFAGTLFRSPSNFHSVILEASKISRLGVRAILLACTDTLSISYCKSKDCILCGERFSFDHFLTCSVLGPCVSPSLAAFIDAKDWAGVSCLLLSRFQVFIHAIRGGELSSDETDLFDALVSIGSDAE